MPMASGSHDFFGGVSDFAADFGRSVMAGFAAAANGPAGKTSHSGVSSSSGLGGSEYDDDLQCHLDGLCNRAAGKATAVHDAIEDSGELADRSEKMQNHLARIVQHSERGGELGKMNRRRVMAVVQTLLYDTGRWRRCHCGLRLLQVLYLGSASPWPWTRGSSSGGGGAAQTKANITTSILAEETRNGHHFDVSQQCAILMKYCSDSGDKRVETLLRRLAGQVRQMALSILNSDGEIEEEDAEGDDGDGGAEACEGTKKSTEVSTATMPRSHLPQDDDLLGSSGGAVEDQGQSRTATTSQKKGLQSSTGAVIAFAGHAEDTDSEPEDRPANIPKIQKPPVPAMAGDGDLLDFAEAGGAAAATKGTAPSASSPAAGISAPPSAPEANLMQSEAQSSAAAAGSTEGVAVVDDLLDM